MRISYSYLFCDVHGLLVSDMPMMSMSKSDMASISTRRSNPSPRVAPHIFWLANCTKFLVGDLLVVCPHKVIRCQTISAGWIGRIIIETVDVHDYFLAPLQNSYLEKGLFCQVGLNNGAWGLSIGAVVLISGIVPGKFVGMFEE